MRPPHAGEERDGEESEQKNRVMTITWQWYSCRNKFEFNVVSMNVCKSAQHMLTLPICYLLVYTINMITDGCEMWVLSNIDASCELTFLFLMYGIWFFNYWPVGCGLWQRCLVSHQIFELMHLKSCLAWSSVKASFGNDIMCVPLRVLLCLRIATVGSANYIHTRRMASGQHHIADK